MAAVNVAITGVLIDLYGRVISGPLKLVGELVRSDVGIGGGPIIPPPDGGDGKPPGFWGPNDPRPQPPIHLPPENGKPPIDIGAHPEHPIVIPDPVPPDMQPPSLPPPGTATAVPGNWPVAPVQPAPYMVVNYPGVGPLVVVPPPHAMPA